MARYTVHLLKLAPTPQAALEGALFIREGWSWGAFSFGPLWLLWHRHWLFGASLVVLYLLLGAALVALRLHPLAVVAVQMLSALLFGFEGAALRRFALARAGYAEVALVAGAERDEMERRFFATYAPQLRQAPVTLPIAPVLPSPGLAARRRRHHWFVPDARLEVKVALIDYGAGNLHSAGKALLRAATAAGVSLQVTLGANPEEIAAADRIVLPGDGAFRDCRANLSAVDGLEEVLHDTVRVKGRPFLGICVGMQLMADSGEERGLTRGLGWVPGRVVALDAHARGLKVPHMGWNTLEARSAHPVLAGLELGAAGLHAYFLHSYHLVPHNPGDLIASADYGGPVAAIVGHGTAIGTQFHPEKSQGLGIRLLANFLKWAP